MSIKLFGSLLAKDVNIGNNIVSKIYNGNNLVYKKKKIIYIIKNGVVQEFTPNSPIAGGHQSGSGSVISDINNNQNPYLNNNIMQARDLKYCGCYGTPSWYAASAYNSYRLNTPIVLNDNTIKIKALIKRNITVKGGTSSGQDTYIGVLSGFNTQCRNDGWGAWSNIYNEVRLFNAKTSTNISAIDNDYIEVNSEFNNVTDIFTTFGVSVRWYRLSYTNCYLTTLQCIIKDFSIEIE